MSELTGPELAARLRALLPEERRASYDDYLDLFSSEVEGELEPPGNSICGALAALTGPFRECVAVCDFATAGAVMDEMERLLAESRRTDRADGSMWNSVLACFLESVLPVEAAAFDAVRPRLGPLIESHARQFDPWWLEPKPQP